MRNTHKRENLSQHTDDVVGEVKHAARRLRRALLLQKGRAARPRTEATSPTRLSSGWSRQAAAPAMPGAAAAAAEGRSDSAGRPETVTEGAVSSLLSPLFAANGKLVQMCSSRDLWMLCSINSDMYDAQRSPAKASFSRRHPRRMFFWQLEGAIFESVTLPRRR